MLENDGFSHLKWQNYDSHLKMRKKAADTSRREPRHVFPRQIASGNLGHDARRRWQNMETYF